MDRGGGNSARPFIRQVRKYGFIGGGVDSGTGETVNAPWELAEARIIDGLCQRYSCLPSQLLQEDADWILHAHALMREAGDMDNGE